MSARAARRAAVAALAVAAAAPAAAPAFWAALGSGTVSAGVATLGAPALTASGGAGQAALDWTPVVPPGGAGAVSYAATRDGAPVTSGGCAPAAITGTACTDTTAPAGSHTYVVTASWRSWTAASDSASATVAPARFVLAGPAATTAGVATSVTITAQDASGATSTAYTGMRSLTFAGASAIGTNTPTAGGTAFGSPTSVAFSGGTATVSLRLYRAEAAAVTAAAGQTTTPTPLAITVNKAAAQTTASAGGGQTTTLGAPFGQPLVALVADAYGNPYAGVPVTFTAPTSGASAAIAGATATTNGSGLATSGTVTANTTLGSYQATAAASGAGSATFALTNVQAAVAQVDLVNRAGGTAGLLEADDLVVIRFSQRLQPSSICTGWTGTPARTGATVAMSRSANNVPTYMTVGAPTGCSTFRFQNGATGLNLGTQPYFTQGNSRNGTFANSEVRYDDTARTLTVKLGAYTGSTLGPVSTTSATFTPVAGMLDAYGQAVATTSRTDTIAPPF